MRAAGELVVITRPGPTTFFDGADGMAGFEYDLAKAFAEYLGVRLRIIPANGHSAVLPTLIRGEGDFAAAGLTAAEGDQLPVRFTPAYQEVRQQVVYRLGTPWPQTPEHLIGRAIEVSAESRHARQLAKLAAQHPELRWTTTPGRTTEELLQLVWEGLLDITVADSHVIALNRQFFPELQLAFTLSEPEGLAWAFREDKDDSLYYQANEFLSLQRRNGELAQLLDRYYGPASQANFINLTVYQSRIHNRLPRFQRMFERAAKRYRLDWRLLAAVGYQESYWDPAAVSPTGVRGIMMLTEDTAQRMGVRNRRSPEQSIAGGARYLRELVDKLPATITGPDRTWMALAAYNIGPNHLESARVITHMQGGDPNRWKDVSQRLPLLADPKWAARTRYGMARGREPVQFVNRVRTYYDVLVRLDEEERARRQTDALKLKIPAI